jgi:hypothetical protein
MQSAKMNNLDQDQVRSPQKYDIAHKYEIAHNIHLVLLLKQQLLLSIQPRTLLYSSPRLPGGS